MVIPFARERKLKFGESSEVFARAESGAERAFIISFANSGFSRENARMPEEAPQKPRILLWLTAAAIALVAAFFFQWKNGIEQASIAQTDAGDVVRVKTEPGARPGFRVFFNGNADDFAEALLCDGDGNALCVLARSAADPERFDVTADFDSGKTAGERFLRVVVPALKSEGAPVVLVVENPFRK